MSRTFRSCSLDQPYLLPPSLHDWLPESHLARFVADLIPELDLSEIVNDYGRKDNRGLAAYHPTLMVRLLLYAYATGQPSSRKIEQATYTDLAFRYLAANQHPDHDTIANFRRRHLAALARLFLQVLRLCQAAGLVKLGQVAIDGTKVKANASRRRSLSYDRLCERELHWQKVVQELLKKAEQADRLEADQPTDHELPAALAHAESRLEALRFARESLAAKARRNLLAAQQAAQDAKRKRGQSRKDQKANELRRVKANKAKKTLLRRRKEAAQPTTSHNFVDPDSQLMRDGATGSTAQAYNAQAAVDEGHIIVACEVTDEANDTFQLAPMVRQVTTNLQQVPKCVTADTGYWDTVTIAELESEGYWLLVPPERKVVDPLPITATRNSIATAMRERLSDEEGKKLYQQRSTTVEPVFGWIKEQRGFRQFALRGKARVRAEWALICCTHNLLKLFAGRAKAKSGACKKDCVNVVLEQNEGERDESKPGPI